MGPRLSLFVSPAGEPFRAAPGGPPPIAAWFAGADANGDGALSYAEFLADFRRWFAALDTDHDGEIAPAEVTRYETEILPEMASRGGGGFGGGRRGGGRMGGPRRGGRQHGGGMRGGGTSHGRRPCRRRGALRPARDPAPDHVGRRRFQPRRLARRVRPRRRHPLQPARRGAYAAG